MPGDRRSASIGSRPPDHRNTSPTYGLNTRRTTRSAISQNDIESMASNVKDSESGKQYLISKLICNIDQPFTLTHLISVLFQITQMSSTIPLPVTSAIRAVAFLLKDHVACEIADSAATRLTDVLTPRLVDHVIAAIAPQVASILTTSEALRDTLVQATTLQNTINRERDEQEGDLKVAAERFEEAADTLYESIEDCNNSYKLLTPSLEFTQDRLNNLSTQLSQQPRTQSTSPTVNTVNPATVSQTQTYSSVTAAHLPPSIDKAVSRAAIRARQILLDPLPGDNLFPPDTPHAAIVLKLKTALANIRDKDTPVGNIKAVLTLHNGGLIVELESESLAEWLRLPASKEALKEQFDNAVSFRTRTFPIVAEYLPIQIQIHEDTLLRSIEQDNNLLINSIVSARWIKPPTRRSPTQRKAFALLHIADPHTANLILKEGICIGNERISVRKDKREPIRCAKCQKYGHIARNCTATTDTCGTCGNQHRTSECTTSNTTRCVNCRSDQHASWSRSCPDFARRCELINEKFPENSMPYFPTELSWTHVNQPQRSLPFTYSKPQRAQSPPQHATSQQTTIPFQPRPRPPNRLLSPQRPQTPALTELMNRLSSSPFTHTNTTNFSSSPLSSPLSTPSNV